MITAQIESLRQGLEEFKQVIPAHYDELSVHKAQGIPLSPCWERYGWWEDNGGLLYATLRENGQLAGYLLAFIHPGLHYTSCLTAMGDIFYIRQESRGKEGGAYKLFRCAESELRRRGVQAWFAGSKVHKSSAPLLRKFGFAPVDLMHVKWLTREV